MIAKRSVILALMVFAAALLTIPASAKVPLRLAYNPTESAAVGFYLVGSPTYHLGDQVLSRLPKPIAAFAAGRRYIPLATPVLKTVVAGAGDMVCRAGGLVSVNGRPTAIARASDRAGRPLPLWSGCRRLRADEVFLLGRHPGSFDGRYFGPTPERLLIGTARPLWTW